MEIITKDAHVLKDDNHVVIHVYKLFENSHRYTDFYNCANQKSAERLAHALTAGAED